jgi:hypothetical protein
MKAFPAALFAFVLLLTPASAQSPYHLGAETRYADSNGLVNDNPSSFCICNFQNS